MSKICFYFESYYVGGLDTFTTQLINHWNSPEDTITLICNKSHSGVESLMMNITNQSCKVEIHNMLMVPEFANFSYKVSSNSIFHKFFSVLAYFVMMPYYILCSYKKLELNRFDQLMVINGGYPACQSCRGVGISWHLFKHKKSIHNFHNFAQKSNFVIALIDYFVDKMLNNATSNFVSVSSICAESLRLRRAFRYNTNIKYIYNGIDDLKVQPTFSFKRELGIEDNCKILLMLATYEERKGHMFIMNVFHEVIKKNSRTQLVFCGYGTQKDKQKYIDLARSLGISDKTTFLDFKNNPMEYLAQSDLLLIGSQSFESFGLTAIEAMKYRKVVVSTNIGGLKEVIKDGEGGYLFHSNDVLGMSSRIIDLLDTNNRQLLLEQQELGYLRFTNKFRIQDTVSKYKTLFNEII